MGLEEEAIFSLLQRATSENKIRSAFTCGSIQGSIYVEGVLDADMISILKLIPGIIRNKSGVVCQLVDPPDWVKLLTMHDPTTVVKAGQWIWVCNGGGNLGSSGFGCSSPQETNSIAGGCLTEMKANSHQA